MDYIVNGGNTLHGELAVYGAKNCALALLGATVLTKEAVRLSNCPKIDDVENMLLLLKALGKRVTRQGETVTVEGHIRTSDIPQHLAKLLRGSGLVLGSTVAECGQAFLPSTGGCAIGKRPIDIHLDGLRAMKVEVTESEQGVLCKGTPHGCTYRLRFASVGATENLLCAATLAEGETTLVNCALEPEVVALENMLCQMGANIDGVGTSVLKVKGVKSLHGTQFVVIPDRIVASTYLACVAACGGKVAVTNCVPQHMSAFLSVLQERFALKRYINAVVLTAEKPPKDYGNIVTAPYPAFPTDVQQIILSLCALSDGGTSFVTEQLFENRLVHNADQLNKMGAEVEVCENVAKIRGKKLHGETVLARDLRGGAGLVVAALGTEGQTHIVDAQHICRGYSNLDVALKNVGANIRLV